MKQFSRAWHHIAPRKIAVYAITFALGITTFLQTALATDASMPAMTFHTTVRAWLQQYVTYYEAHNLEPDAMFTAPTIWLFAPDGKMLQVATVATDPRLENLKKAYASSSAIKGLTGQPTEKQALELLSGLATSGATTPQTRNGNRLAILFLSDSPSCKHCAEFDKAISSMAANSTKHLDVIRVHLSMQ